MLKVKFFILLFIANGFGTLCFAADFNNEQIKLFNKKFVMGTQWGIPYPKDILIEKWHQHDVTEIDAITSRYFLKDISQGQNLKLQGNGRAFSASLASRLDRVITQATLDLDFIYSPTLLAEQSQVKVYLNNEIVAVIPIDSKKAGQKLSQTISLPPFQFSEFNDIKFELIGYYDTQCHNPAHAGLWFEFLSSSKLLVNEEVIALQNDLSLLPAPFFDRRESTMQSVPFVFPEQASINMNQAAGQVASWFGALARWRGNDFPVLIDEMPDKHAVVFATNNNKPFFLKDYPDVDQPTLVMVSHPLNKKLKMLLVLGADDEQLTLAVQGLVMGHNGLSGQAATIDKVDFTKPLKPYDAPYWVRQDRAMKFSELVESEQQLQQSGSYLDTINLNMHIPADLFIWETHGVPVDLKYRHTEPTDPDMSMLNVFINKYLVQSFSLANNSILAAGNSQLRMPLSNQDFKVSSDVLIPSFKLGINNTMSFDFKLLDNTVACISESSTKVVSVDSDSTIDFSGFEHYAEMPNLTSYIYSGLPFTRYADLAETLVVLPKAYGENELGLLFNLLAKMSATTGYPTLNYQLITSDDQWPTTDKDIILINTLTLANGELSESSNLNVLIKNSNRILSQASDLFKPSDYRNMRFIEDDEDDALVSVFNHSQGDIAAISEFESPFSAGRTVLSFMANKPENLELIKDSLVNPAKNQLIKGSIALIHPNKIVHSNVGDKYHTGNLPVWDLTRYHLSQQPFFLLFFILFSVVILAVVVWRLLRYQTRKRAENA